MAGTPLFSTDRTTATTPRLATAAAAFAGFGVLALLVAGPLAAQTVRGRVVDAGTPNVVVGAHVVLLFADGRAAVSVLTNEEGRFQIRAPAPGRYRLQVDMIGRAGTTTSELEVAAGALVDTTLELPLAPVTLPGLDVRSGQRCVLRAVAVGDVVTVWEEARKALALEAAVREQRLFRFDMVRFERHYDESLSRVTRETTRHLTRVTGDPFVSVPAEQLAREGYRERRGDDWFLHGPSGEVLLSQSFLDTHCFFLRRDPGRPDRIGLAFEPVPERRLTDIEGVLWLDQQTAELRTLEFRYTRMPSSLPGGTYGGAVEFQRLPDGAFIVRKWEIYSPITSRNDQLFRGARVGGERVVGRFIDGGEVLNIFARDGHILDTAPRATLAGVVWDSTGGGPAAGAEVFIVGTDIAAQADGSGAYRLRGLMPGRYAVAFRWTAPDSITFEIAPRPVTLEGGEVTELALGTLRLPSGLTTAEIARRDSIAAGGRALGRNDYSLLLRQPSDTLVLGRIAGTVVDERTGRAVAGARVFLRGAPLGDVSISVLSNQQGRFRPLDLRAGEYELIAQHRDYAVHVTTLTMRPGESLDIEIRLEGSGPVDRP